MALTYTGTGGLYTRLGAQLAEYHRVVSGFGTSLNAGVENIYDEFPNSDEDGLAIDGLLAARESYRGVHNTYLTALLTAARNTVVSQVDREGSPLTSKTIANALTELRRQMLTDAATLNRPTVSASAAANGSNLGNAVVEVSVTNEFGDPLDMVFAEDILLTVTSDVSNGATQYAETMTVRGEPAVAANSYLWPGGSGATGTLRITNATTTGLLEDGSFEDWTGTTPDSWTISTGASTVDKDATNKIRGDYGLKITSDGSTLTTIKQQLATTVAPNKVYALNLWAMIDSADASGIVRFRLTDSSGNTLADDAATDNSYTRNTNGEIGTSLTQVSTFFRTSRQLPASGGVWLEIAFTTAPANGRVVSIDHVGLVEATQLYRGGPFAAAFSKDDASALRDEYTITVTNSLTYTSFVRAMDRLFDLRVSSLYLPTSLSPTISDSLIA